MVSNPLREWELKRARLVVKRVLEAGLDFSSQMIPEIVEEMSYATQSKKNPEDCLCYSSSPCHPQVNNLNCFLCSCPNYESWKKDSLGFIGGCRVNSTKGEFYPVPNPGINGLGKEVWDCSDCVAYHSPAVVKRYLEDH